MIYTDFAKEIAKDKESLRNVHSHLQHLSVPELREICDANRKPFAVCLLNVTGDLNIGVSIRSASLMGAQEVLVMGRRKYDLRSTVGAENYINVERIDALDENLEINSEVVVSELKKRNYIPILIETGYENINQIEWLRYSDNRDKLCFIFGNEGRGISQKVIEAIMCEFHRSIGVSIPQHGVLRSYNVSAAVNIVLWHVSNEMGWI